MELDNEKIKEIELIFKKFFGYDIGQTKLIVSKIKTEEDLTEIFEGAKKIFEKNGKNVNKNFFGRNYTILNGNLKIDSSWNKFKKNVEFILKEKGKYKTPYKLLLRPRNLYYFFKYPKLRENSKIFNYKESWISSTEIRKRAKEGKSLKNLVPLPINQYIKQNKLYK